MVTRDIRVWHFTKVDRMWKAGPQSGGWGENGELFVAVYILRDRLMYLSENAMINS